MDKDKIKKIEKEVLRLEEQALKVQYQAENCQILKYEYQAKFLFEKLSMLHSQKYFLKSLIDK